MNAIGCDTASLISAGSFYSEILIFVYKVSLSEAVTDYQLHISQAILAECDT